MILLYYYIKSQKNINVPFYVKIRNMYVLIYVVYYAIKKYVCIIYYILLDYKYGPFISQPLNKILLLSLKSTHITKIDI